MTLVPSSFWLVSFAALLVLTCVRLLSWPPDFLEQQLAFSVEDAEQQEVDRRIAPALSQLRSQWNAPRRALPPVYHCGASEGYFAAYVWEEFVGLDVGEARGDWVVAAGAEAHRSCTSPWRPIRSCSNCSSNPILCSMVITRTTHPHGTRLMTRLCPTRTGRAVLLVW